MSALDSAEIPHRIQNLGALLAIERTRKGLSQAQIALALGESKETVSQFEAWRSPTWRMVRPYLAALGMTESEREQWLAWANFQTDESMKEMDPLQHLAIKQAGLRALKFTGSRGSSVGRALDIPTQRSRDIIARQLKSIL